MLLGGTALFAAALWAPMDRATLIVSLAGAALAAAGGRRLP